MITNLKQKFQFIAWGITLQVICAIGIAIASLVLSHSWRGMDTLRSLIVVSMVVSLIATILTLVGSFGMIPDLKKRGIPTSGAICVGIAFSFGVINAIIGGATVGVNLSGNGSPAASVLTLLFSLAALILFWVGTGKLSDYVSGINTAKIGYAIITISIAVMFLLGIIIAAAMPRNGVEVVGVLAIIMLLAMLVGYIMIICGWWAGVSGAADIDNGALDGDEAASAPAAAYQAAPAASAQEVAGYRASLRLLDDQQLNYIIANPASYNPAFVAEATTMIMKRRAWERVSVMSDEELLKMVNAGSPAYSNEECDAASMVLYTRKSPLFMAQFAGLGQAELQGIVNNPDNYYEGYVEAAREALGLK